MDTAEDTKREEKEPIDIAKIHRREKLQLEKQIWKF